MSDMAHARQGKNHSTRSDTKAAESTPKAATSAMSATRVPAWANAWGDQPIVELVSPIADLQAKGVLSRPGDASEQEADQVAEQVMRLPTPGSPPMTLPPDTPKASLSLTASMSQISPLIQRALADSESASTPATDGSVPETASTSDFAMSGPAPEATALEQTPTPGLIVEDSVDQLEAGQMKKSDFLAQLRDAVCKTTEQALAGTIWSTAGCPWVDHWFGYYSNRDSQQIERALRRYAPETANATSASNYILIICERVRSAITVWSTTGEITGVPEGVELPGAGLMGTIGSIASGVASVGSSIAGGAASIVSGVASAGANIVSGVGSVLSDVGGVLFKEREGGAREVGNPQAIQGQLGSGSSLDGRVKGRMEQAFGMNFSHVRVHTDSTATDLSESLNARAFTIGQDVAFGAGEYQPGTLIGDALIAHELAHVVQQGNANASTIPMQKGGTEYNTLEEDADMSAVGAMVSLWSGAKGGLTNIAQNTMPRLKSGLGLQRCAGVQRQVMPQRYLGMPRLRDYVDKDPSHDPSLLHDTDIEATAEYQAYMDPDLTWHPSIHVSRKEALLACKLLLRAMRQGESVTWEGNAREFVVSARHQSSVAGVATGMRENQITMTWKQSHPGSGTTFEVWASAPWEGTAPKLDPTTTINCWEMILLAAYRAKMLTWDWIHDLYTMHAFDWNSYLVSTLTRGTAMTYHVHDPHTPLPLRGDIVFFNGSAHVALATGTTNGSGQVEVISFWPPPDTAFTGPTPYAIVDKVKLTTIEVLVDYMIHHMGPVTVTFARPPW